MKFEKKSKILKFFDENNFLVFKIGIFLLVSAPVFASFFFLITILNSLFKNTTEIFKNKFNYPFFLVSILLLISCFFSNNNVSDISSNLKWIGLANWIPYFICFFALQNFSNTQNKRIEIIYSFIFGCFPLIISGFGQYFFNWHGPIGIFNNLIIWFQRPVFQGHGLTGLFNNANYAATWFLIIWPMILTSLQKSKLSNFKKVLIFIFMVSIFLSIILTRSRNGWFGSIISLPFLGPLYLKIFLFIVFALGLFFIFLGYLSFLTFDINLIIKNLIPTFIRNEFSVIQIVNLRSFTRVDIWIQAINFILEKPLLGWGAGSFPILYSLENNNWIAHPHNISLELAHSYGLPASILFTITVVIILYKSFSRIYLKNSYSQDNLFDKAWWTSTFTLFLSQMVDVQYFDFRISFTFWILLSGLVSIINNEKYTNQIP